MTHHVSRFTLYVLVWLLVACSGRPDTLQEIRKRGVLHVGLDPSYPPFEALAPDGVLFGLDVDLGRELAGRLAPDVVANFVFISYDGLYDALAIGQVDVLISALVVEPGRMEDFAYSASYFDAGLALVVPAGAAGDIKEMQDLAGRTVALEYATEGEVEARRWARRLANLTVRPLTTAEEALAAVLEGTADAALVDRISARLYLRENPTLTLVPRPVTTEPYALVVRAKDQMLLQAINEALEGMAAEGVLDAFLSHWL